MIEEEFSMFKDIVINHFAQKNNTEWSNIELTYMTWANNRFKAGCLIKPSYDIDILDVRLEQI